MTEHQMTLSYTIDDDGVHLTCQCGVDVALGFHPTPDDAKRAEQAHHDVVGCAA